MKRIFSALVLTAASMLANAYSVTFETTVDSRDNLYYADWGHWFTQAADNALGNPDSNPAHAVWWGDSGSSFNFAGFDTLSITASGSVIDHFDTATDANGDSCNPTCLFNDGYFRGLPAYSLIGIWSSSADTITPLGYWQDELMFIGSSIDLKVPEITSAYLFLAENDGGFGDNYGHYNVQLTASVPEPGTLGLLLVGIAGLAIARRRMK